MNFKNQLSARATLKISSGCDSDTQLDPHAAVRHKCTGFSTTDLKMPPNYIKSPSAIQTIFPTYKPISTLNSKFPILTSYFAPLPLHSSISAMENRKWKIKNFAPPAYLYTHIPVYLIMYSCTLVFIGP